MLVLRDLPRLAAMTYDFDALQRLYRQKQWITVQVIVSTGPRTWRARNPFPGAALSRTRPPALPRPLSPATYDRFDNWPKDRRSPSPQGVEMDCPSTIDVTLAGEAALVSGAVTRIA